MPSIEKQIKQHMDISLKAFGLRVGDLSLQQEAYPYALGVIHGLTGALQTPQIEKLENQALIMLSQIKAAHVQADQEGPRHAN